MIDVFLLGREAGRFDCMLQHFLGRFCGGIHFNKFLGIHLVDGKTKVKATGSKLKQPHVVLFIISTVKGEDLPFAVCVTKQYYSGRIPAVQIRAGSARIHHQLAAGCIHVIHEEFELVAEHIHLSADAAEQVDRTTIIPDNWSSPTQGIAELRFFFP